MTAERMDKIVLSRMEFFARHGVFEEEARLGARFVVDAELYLPLAGVTAELGRTVNYAEVYELVREEVTGTRYALLEGLANRLAVRLLATFPPLAAVTVRVHKPHAPLPGIVGDVMVEVRRERE